MYFALPLRCVVAKERYELMRLVSSKRLKCKCFCPLFHCNVVNDFIQYEVRPPFILPPLRPQEQLQF